MGRSTEWGQKHQRTHRKGPEEDEEAPGEGRKEPKRPRRAQKRPKGSKEGAVAISDPPPCSAQFASGGVGGRYPIIKRKKYTEDDGKRATSTIEVDIHLEPSGSPGGLRGGAPGTKDLTPPPGSFYSSFLV